MTILLRVGLALLFFCVAILTFRYPGTAKNYLDVRYKGLYHYAFANSMLTLYLPNSLITKTPACLFKVVALVIASGGVALLLDRTNVVVVYAYSVMIFGGLLHMPYTHEQLHYNAISQIRKLVCVFAVFCAMLLVVTSPHNPAQSASTALGSKAQ